LIGEASKKRVDALWGNLLLDKREELTKSAVHYLGLGAGKKSFAQFESSSNKTEQWGQFMSSTYTRL